MPERRIETKASRTADIVCMMRAASSLEKDPRLRTNDWVARLLLPRLVQAIFVIPPFRRLIVRRLSPPGTYEWVIARTRYIDAIFTRVPELGFSQVVFLGAGFDSRAIRFSSELKGLPIFELDAPTTQAAKISQYRKRKINVPENLSFVGIDFEKQSLAQRLEEAGSRSGVKTLVVMEGVTQYLRPDAVHAALQTLSAYVGSGSWLVFDYAHASAVGPGLDGKDEKRMAKSLEKSGETWQFGLEEDQLDPLLASYQFKVIDQKNPHELEEIDFKNEEGKISHHIIGVQSIVTAVKE